MIRKELDSYIRCTEQRDQNSDKCLDALVANLPFQAKNKQLLELQKQLIREYIRYIIFVHRNEERDSGGPYARHPYEVMLLVGKYTKDIGAWVDALTHDAAETLGEDATTKFLEKRYGKKKITRNEKQRLIRENKSTIDGFYENAIFEVMQKISDVAIQNREAKRSNDFCGVEEIVRSIILSGQHVLPVLTRKPHSNYLLDASFIRSTSMPYDAKARALLTKLADRINNEKSMSFYIREERQRPAGLCKIVSPYIQLKLTSSKELRKIYELSIKKTSPEKYYHLFRLWKCLMQNRVIHETGDFRKYNNRKKLKILEKNLFVINEVREYLTGLDRLLRLYFDLKKQAENKGLDDSIRDGLESADTVQDIRSLREHYFMLGDFRRFFARLYRTVGLYNDLARLSSKTKPEVAFKYLWRRTPKKSKAELRDIFQFYLQNRESSAGGVIEFSDIRNIYKLIETGIFREDIPIKTKNTVQEGDGQFVHAILAYQLQHIVLLIETNGILEGGFEESVRYAKEMAERYNLRTAEEDTVRTTLQGLQNVIRHSSTYHIHPRKMDELRKELEKYDREFRGLEALTDSGGVYDSIFDATFKYIVVPRIKKEVPPFRLYRLRERIFDIKERYVTAKTALLLYEIIKKFIDDKEYTLKGLAWEMRGTNPYNIETLVFHDIIHRTFSEIV
ncbi:MAG: hypothetical protein QXK37_04265 [Candidatus Woesearchaeota archaeon]